MTILLTRGEGMKRAFGMLVLASLAASSVGCGVNFEATTKCKDSAADAGTLEQQVDACSKCCLAAGARRGGLASEGKRAAPCECRGGG
jgi:hypothetical protein